MYHAGLIRSLMLGLALALLAAPAARADEAEGAGTPVVQAQQAQAPAEEGWQVVLEPVVWAPTMDVNLSYGDRSVGKTITPEDLKGNFEFGFSGRLEARNGPWGFETEGMYVNLADDVTFRRVTGSVRANQTLLQAAGLYRLNEGEIPVDLVAGLRYYNWNVNTSFTADGVLFTRTYENKRNLTWADPVLGLRASVPLSDDFRFGLYGDLGGFGLGSDLSWRAAARFDWEVSDSTSLVLGYSALGADYRQGSGFDTVDFDFSLYGPMLGASFKL